MLLLSGALAVLERRVRSLFSACRCSPSHYLPQERAAALGGSEEAETWAFLATHFAADGRRYLLERLGFSGTPLDGLVRTLLLVQICCVLLRFLVTREAAGAPRLLRHAFGRVGLEPVLVWCEMVVLW